MSRSPLAALLSAALLLACAAPAFAATSARVVEASLVVTGSEANDDITIVTPPNGSGYGTYRIVDPAGVVAGNGCAVDEDNSNQLNCTIAPTPIVVGQTPSGVGMYGEAGDDTLRAMRPVDPANSPWCTGPYLYGGDGADELVGSDCGDALDGGSGTDRLHAGAGRDYLIPGGQPGLSAGSLISDGADTVDGGPDGPDQGQGDSIDYSQRTDNLMLNLATGAAWGAAGENDTVTGVENVTGGKGDDTIVGGPGPNIIVGDRDQQVYGEPGIPIGPAPPASAYGANTIDVREGGADIVNCGGSDRDRALFDSTDQVSACESDPDPPCPTDTYRKSAGQPCIPLDCAAPSVICDGPRPAPIVSGPDRPVGTVGVSPAGYFVLPGHQVQCPAITPPVACQVTTVVSARLASKAKRPVIVGLGRRAYTVSAASHSEARGRLAPSGLRQIKRRRSIPAMVRVTVTSAGLTATKTFRVTLKAPRRQPTG